MKLFFILGALLLGQISYAIADGSRKFDHLVLIVLENAGYDEAIQQPDLYRLSRQGALFTNFSASIHPSQGNYINMVAGDPLGIDHDDVVNLSQSQIGDLLEGAGLDWHVYAEDYPGNCFLRSSKGNYARKHNPFLSFLSVSKNAKRCAKITNEASFESDVRAGTLPAFSMYVPNLLNDGHDTSVDYAGKFLMKKFGPIFNDPVLMKNTLFVITFDENDGATGNKIYTVFLGGHVSPLSRSDQKLGHASILKLLEQEFSLGTLGRADSTSELPQNIWK